MSFSLDLVMTHDSFRGKIFYCMSKRRISSHLLNNSMDKVKKRFLYDYDIAYYRPNHST